jgi:hypothetical protein
MIAQKGFVPNRRASIWLSMIAGSVSDRLVANDPHSIHR